MAQYAPAAANDASISTDALAWARIAGLVDIHPDGSWNLTPQGLAGMLEFVGNSRGVDARPSGDDRRRHHSIA